jgi:hypothetical protein
VKELLDKPEFQDPAAFDEAAAGFLRSAAAVVPEQVAEILDRVLNEASAEDLLEDRIPRRDIVWSLEYLLWPEETYEFAVTQLLRLAEHETESFANNATGVLVDSFQSYLGGTVVSHGARLEWLDQQAVEPISKKRREILTACAAAGLRSHQTRMHGTYQDETGVRDWYPRTYEEAVEVARGSWERLIRLIVVAEADSRKELVNLLVDSIRGAMTQGIADDVLGSLEDEEWTADEKAKLAAPLRDVLKYDNPGDEWRQKIESTIERLLGDSFSTRLQIILRTPLWDLHEDDEWQKPPAPLKGLAEQAVAERAELEEALNITENLEDQGTAYAFWVEVSKRMDPEELASLAVERETPVGVAFQAAVAEGARGNADWVDAVIKKALEGGPGSDRVVQLVQAAGLNDQRGQLLTDAAIEGAVPGEELSQLLYGASIREVSQSVALGLIAACASAGSGLALEHALGMLHQFEEVNEDLLSDPDVQKLATTLAIQALSVPEGGTMKTHYAYELAKSLPAEKSLAILEARIQNKMTLPDPPEIELLVRVFTDEPEPAWEWARAVMEKAVREEYKQWAIWAENLHLVTHMGRANPKATLEWFQSQEDDAKHRLVRHVDFGQLEPDEFLTSLLASFDDEELRESAAVAYFNSLGTVSGPYYLGLERQRERLEKWRDVLTGEGKSWAEEVIKSYDKQIPKQRQRDEEEHAL